MELQNYTITLTSKEALKIIQIVERMAELAGAHGFPCATEERFLDIAVAHNDVPLDFEAWLEADDFNFMHDVAGITENLDRLTGKLQRFMPRFAKG